jgi:hypothetical protein
MEAETISKNGASLKCLMSRRNLLKRSFLFFTAFCIGISTFAQDIIRWKDGDDIQALIQEIDEVNVKYKKFDNPNGPIYTLKKSEIFMIRYANGSKDMFVPATTHAAFCLLRDNDGAMERFLEKSDATFSKQFRKGTLFSRSGGTLLGAGIGITCASLFLMVVGVGEKSDELILAGYVGIYVGPSIMLTSIPFLAVGNSMKRRAVDGYEERYFNNKTSYQPSLNFQITGDGVGLALKF